MTRRTVHWFGRPLGIQEQGLAAIGISTMTVLMHLGLLITLTIATYTGLDRSPNENLPLGTVHTPGYTTEMLHDRIVKLTNQQSLIYIKPISGFYSPDHQPAICWTGSGYQFKGVTEKILAGKLRYSARLEKNGEILYSAWWYDNGISTTTSQLDWRWDAFRYSRRYALVNVTAATPARLETEIRKFKNSNPCQQLLMN
jgi:exosortase N